VADAGDEVQATLRNNGPQPLRLLWVDTYAHTAEAAPI
jgi:hypothetical protein